MVPAPASAQTSAGTPSLGNEGNSARPGRGPVRSDVSLSLKEGGAYSLMVGLGETYLPAFALALGMGQVTAGLISTVPLLAGALIQLLVPVLVPAVGSYRRWVVLCAAIQCTSFVPLAVAAVAGYLPPAALFLAAALYWGAGMGGSPAWNTWITALVPPLVRTHFFAKRHRLTQVGSLVGFLAGGVFLQIVSGSERIAAFAVLFGVAFLCRLISLRWLALHSEPVKPPPADEATSFGTALRTVAQGQGGRFLAFVLFLHLSVHIAAPYFNPFMLKQLELSYIEYGALISASFVAKAFWLPFFAAYAKRRGTRSLLWFATAGIVTLPALWLVSHDIVYLFVVQLVSGMFWAGFDLAYPLLTLETIPERQRLSVLTAFNLCHAVVLVVASLIGGSILDSFGRNERAYFILFVASTVLRAGSLLFLRRVSVPELSLSTFWRTIALRPSAGMLVTPILDTVRRRRRRSRSAVVARRDLPHSASSPEAYRHASLSSSAWIRLSRSTSGASPSPTRETRPTNHSGLHSGSRSRRLLSRG